MQLFSDFMEVEFDNKKFKILRSEEKEFLIYEIYNGKNIYPNIDDFIRLVKIYNNEKPEYYNSGSFTLDNLRNICKAQKVKIKYGTISFSIIALISLGTHFDIDKDLSKKFENISNSITNYLELKDNYKKDYSNYTEKDINNAIDSNESLNEELNEDSKKILKSIKEKYPNVDISNIIRELPTLKVTYKEKIEKTKKTKKKETFGRCYINKNHIELKDGRKKYDEYGTYSHELLHFLFGDRYNDFLCEAIVRNMNSKIHYSKIPDNFKDEYFFLQQLMYYFGEEELIDLMIKNDEETLTKYINNLTGTNTFERVIQKGNFISKCEEDDIKISDKDRNHYEINKINLFFELWKQKLDKNSIEQYYKARNEMVRNINYHIHPEYLEHLYNLENKVFEKYNLEPVKLNVVNSYHTEEGLNKLNINNLKILLIKNYDRENVVLVDSEKWEKNCGSIDYLTMSNVPNSVEIIKETDFIDYFDTYKSEYFQDIYFISNVNQKAPSSTIIIPHEDGFKSHEYRIKINKDKIKNMGKQR